MTCSRCEDDGYIDVDDDETGGVIGPAPCPECSVGASDLDRDRQADLERDRGYGRYGRDSEDPYEARMERHSDPGR